MWILVFVYFFEITPYVEKVSGHSNMIKCFEARDRLAAEVGKGDGYFKSGQQAICIQMWD